MIVVGKNSLNFEDLINFSILRSSIILCTNLILRKYFGGNLFVLMHNELLNYVKQFYDIDQNK